MVRDYEMEVFRSVARCGLEDIKSVDCFYTCNNKKKGEGMVFSKLDRVRGNRMWCDKFPTIEAIFVSEETGGKFPFRYYKISRENPASQRIVSSCWQRNVYGTLMFKTIQKLKTGEKELKILNGAAF